MQTLLFFSLLSFVTVKGIQMKSFGVEGVPSLIRSDRPSIPNPYISYALVFFCLIQTVFTLTFVVCFKLINLIYKAKSPGLVVMGGDS